MLAAWAIITIIESVLDLKKDGDRQMFFLVGWYMLWKLFHDKNKD